MTKAPGGIGFGLNTAASAGVLNAMSTSAMTSTVKNTVNGVARARQTRVMAPSVAARTRACLSQLVEGVGDDTVMENVLPDGRYRRHIVMT